MTRLHSFVLVYLVTVSTAPSVAAEQPELLDKELAASGWIQLFDGHSLFGWQKTSDADWHVADGAIHVTSGEPGFLMTTSRFADYELHIEFRAPAATNSGIFLRTIYAPSDPATDCYELNIAPPDNPFPTGSLVGRSKATKPPSSDPWDGDWHTLRVCMQGARVLTWLDGHPQADYTDTTHRRLGHIGLQLNRGKVAFRNIRLRPRVLTPIFNGQDLTGWNTERAENSRFEVTNEGELRVLDGRGQLESEGRYANFLMQLECRVDGDGLNSGIFFRCISGDLMNGYESQIHNGFNDGDRTQPVDCGTGGIFRRQNARLVVANDRQWFTKTILADGPHIATWVDGYPVADWTDTREPHPNPRRGLRLEAGTLCIQGHDPTTDLRFRNLQIVELPEQE